MLLLMRITIHIPVEVTQNLITFKKNKKKYKKVYIRSTIRTFTDYKRKTGISPLLANKDRWTQIRKTIMDYGQTKYSQVLPGTTYCLGFHRPTIRGPVLFPILYLHEQINIKINSLWHWMSTWRSHGHIFIVQISRFSYPPIYQQKCTQ